jgi:hypothetical protein
MIIVLLPCLSHAWGSKEGEHNNLPDMAESLADQIINRYAGRKLYIRKESVLDQNSAVLPFARQLTYALENSLTRVGFRFADSTMGNDDVIQLDVSYIVEQDKVRVTIRTKDVKGNYHTVLGTIPRSGFANELFQEDVDERIGRLARNLASQCNLTRKLKLLVQPVVSSDMGSSSRFAEHATTTLTAALKKENNIDVRLKGAPVSRTRSLSPELPFECGDAVYTGDDATLHTKLNVDGANIYLTATILSPAIKEQSCTVIAADKVTIPHSLVKLPITDDSINRTALYADIETQNDGKMLSISTPDGGKHQIYHAGENYTLTAQVKAPLYLYVYDIYPDGKKVEPISPFEGETEILRHPGIIYEIPEEMEKGGKGIEVLDGDFGTDVIKVFASDRKLPLPKLDDRQQTRSFTAVGTRGGVRQKIQAELAAGRPVINPADLVDYYRGVAAKKGAKLYEASIFVETRPKK